MDSFGRKHKRYKVYMTVRFTPYKGNGQTFLGIANDISYTGLSLSYASAIAAFKTGDLLSADIVLPDKSIVKAVGVKVMNATQASPDHYNLGIQFIDPDLNKMRKIMDFIASLGKTGQLA